MYEYEKKEILQTPRPQIPAWMPKEDTKLWEKMEFYLTNRELSCPIAQYNGWYPSSCAGDEYDRVVMPAMNSSGLAYWQARLMETAPLDVKRYQSPAVPRGDSVIQVWPMHSDYMPVLILTEGPMDALASASVGIPAIALMGLYPSDEAIALIKLIAQDVQHVTFFADRDAIKEAVALSRRFAVQGLPISISDPTPYKDLAAMSTKRRKQILGVYRAATSGSSNKFQNPTERN